MELYNYIDVAATIFRLVGILIGIGAVLGTGLIFMSGNILGALLFLLIVLFNAMSTYTIGVVLDVILHFMHEVGEIRMSQRRQEKALELLTKDIQHIQRSTSVVREWTEYMDRRIDQSVSKKTNRD